MGGGLGETRGLCRGCGRPVPARYVEDGGAVFLERDCPDHGRARAMVAETLAAWERAMAAPSKPTPPPLRRASEAPCPAACGPCPAHRQRCNLPVFSITNACDLRCPICFTYNRADRLYFMSPEEMDRHLDFVIEATGGVDLVNVTGGEPTMHPRLLDLLERARRRPEIGRVTVNSNGLRLARDPGLARALADLGVYLILSLDTLDPERSRAIHGRDIVAEKRAALEAVERVGLQTTLLMVLAGGVNEVDLPPILGLALDGDAVRSLTVQTMTYTGQGGGAFLPRRHVPVDGVARRIEEASGGRIRREHFLPLPSAHPLCYGVAYLLLDGAGGVHSFTDLLDDAAIAAHLADGYLLRPSDRLEDELRAAIDRLWSEGGHDRLLAALKSLLGRLYPPDEALTVHQRQRRAEQSVKTIYVHAHMDEDTFDVDRAARCPDQVPVLTDGQRRLIGACSYNLFYRQQDERFWVIR